MTTQDNKNKLKLKVTFSSDKLRFKIANQSDTNAFYTWWNDPAVMKHVGFPNGLNIPKEKVATILKKNPCNDPRNKTVIYTVYDAINNCPIGEASYGELTLNKSARIGL